MLDLNAITLAVLAILGSSLTAIVTYLLTRKKNVAESDNVNVTSSKEAVGLLRESMAELRDEVRELRLRVDALESDKAALVIDKRVLARANEVLTDQVHSLQTQVAALTIERDHFRSELTALQTATGTTPPVSDFSARKTF